MVEKWLVLRKAVQEFENYAALWEGDDVRRRRFKIIILIIIISNMLMPVKQNSFTHLRVLLVLTDRGILAQSN